ncbi:endonuclease-reverse transcriptase domain-containing protein [Hirsutella rhossiliensis]
MNEHGLRSLLPRGTKTWQGKDQESTIDLVLTTSELADEVATCAIHRTDHGSDHRAIQTTFDITMPERSARPRLLFKNAPWNLIRARVKDNLRLLPWAVDVQTQTDQLMRVVLGAIHEVTPRARPSPILHNFGGHTRSGETKQGYNSEQARREPRDQTSNGRPKKQRRTLAEYTAEYASAEGMRSCKLCYKVTNGALPFGTNAFRNERT